MGPTDLLHPSLALYFKNFLAFLFYFLKCPSFSTIESYDLNVALWYFPPYI